MAGAEPSVVVRSWGGEGGGLRRKGAHLPSSYTPTLHALTHTSHTCILIHIGWIQFTNTQFYICVHGGCCSVTCLMCSCLIFI